MDRAVTTVAKAVFMSVTKAAIQEGVTVENKIDELLRRGLGWDMEQPERPAPASKASVGTRCLLPMCGLGTSARGLCQRHYMMVRYYLRSGHLDEGWLVRHGRILAGAGPISASDSPETLPKLPRRDLRSVDRWIFECSPDERQRILTGRRD